MKRFIVTAVIASLISGAAFAQSTQVVSSANVVGYNQITLLPSNKYIQVALQFDTTNNTVQNLFPGLPNGSKAYIWTTNQSYIICSRGPANWGTTGTNRILKGAGVMLQLNSPNPTNIYISGDVPTAGTTTVTRVPGYTALSMPYPVDTAVSNLATAKGGKNGDKIYIWTTNQNYIICSRGPANWGLTGTNVLSVGQYYLYQSTTTSTNVNEIKPYTLN